MGRWLTLLLGLAIAAAGGLALLGRLGPRGPEHAPPLDEIDAASRERLERVLRDAERDAGTRRGATRP